MIKSHKTKNFHVPLPEPLYNRLKEEAVKCSIPATKLARQAIKFWLKEREKNNLHSAIKNYASQYGGSEFDLDEDLENTSIDYMTSQNGKE